MKRHADDMANKAKRYSYTNDNRPMPQPSPQPSTYYPYQSAMWNDPRVDKNHGNLNMVTKNTSRTCKKTHSCPTKWYFEYDGHAVCLISIIKHIDCIPAIVPHINRMTMKMSHLIDLN